MITTQGDTFQNRQGRAEHSANGHRCRLPAVPAPEGSGGMTQRCAVGCDWHKVSCVPGSSDSGHVGCLAVWTRCTALDAASPMSLSNHRQDGDMNHTQFWHLPVIPETCNTRTLESRADFSQSLCSSPVQIVNLTLIKFWNLSKKPI